jgi:hypothetical protein
MMATMTAKIIGSGTDNDPYRIDLPCYQILNPQPSGAVIVKNGASISIWLPDDEFDANAQRPSKAKIRTKYSGQKLWDRPDVTDDV